MPLTRKKRRVLLALFLVMGALAFVLWPKTPRLELYTSPPFTLHGETARMQALVPAGWSAQVSPMTSSALKPQVIGYAVTVTPGQGAAGLPALLRGLLIRPDEPRAEVFLVYGLKRTQKDGITRATFRSVGADVLCAERDLDGKTGCRIVYTRSDKPQFEATYQAICRSFKVVK